jgi:hypothetical protein
MAHGFFSQFVGKGMGMEINDTGHDLSNHFIEITHCYSGSSYPFKMPAVLKGHPLFFHRDTHYRSVSFPYNLHSPEGQGSHGRRDYTECFLLFKKDDFRHFHTSSPDAW